MGLRSFHIMRDDLQPRADAGPAMWGPTAATLATCAGGLPGQEAYRQPETTGIATSISAPAGGYRRDSVVALQPHTEMPVRMHIRQNGRAHWRRINKLQLLRASGCWAVNAPGGEETAKSEEQFQAQQIGHATSPMPCWTRRGSCNGRQRCRTVDAGSTAASRGYDANALFGYPIERAVFMHRASDALIFVLTSIIYYFVRKSPAGYHRAHHQLYSRRMRNVDHRYNPIAVRGLRR